MCSTVVCPFIYMEKTEIIWIVPYLIKSNNFYRKDRKRYFKTSSCSHLHLHWIWPSRLSKHIHCWELLQLYAIFFSWRCDYRYREVAEFVTRTPKHFNILCSPTVLTQSPGHCWCPTYHSSFSFKSQTQPDFHLASPFPLDRRSADTRAWGQANQASAPFP
jgi:hypothetical protein